MEVRSVNTDSDHNDCELYIVLFSCMRYFSVREWRWPECQTTDEQYWCDSSMTASWGCLTSRLEPPAPPRDCHAHPSLFVRVLVGCAKGIQGRNSTITGHPSQPNSPTPPPPGHQPQPSSPAQPKKPLYQYPRGPLQSKLWFGNYWFSIYKYIFSDLFTIVFFLINLITSFKMGDLLTEILHNIWVVMCPDVLASHFVRRMYYHFNAHLSHQYAIFRHFIACLRSFDTVPDLFAVDPTRDRSAFVSHDHRDTRLFEPLPARRRPQRTARCICFSTFIIFLSGTGRSDLSSQSPHLFSLFFNSCDQLQFSLSNGIILWMRLVILVNIYLILTDILLWVEAFLE